MWVTAFFQSEGVPVTGLAPSITITDIDTDTVDVSAASMTEVGNGLYKYDFSGFNQAKRYFTICDGGDTLLDPDRYAVADSFDYGEINQILEDTNALQTDLTDGGRLDLLVDAVKERTDNLPDDPASDANVETAISDSESTITTAISTTGSTITTAVSTTELNIRGTDSDTLKTLSGQLDTIEGKADVIGTVADTIQERTSNLPDDPASESAIATAISTTESNIRGADSDTLGILSGQLDANYSAIASIQNNTTRRIDIPTRLVVPDEGEDDVTYRFILGLYDTTGNPEIPDSTPTVQVENLSGIERLAVTSMLQFYEDDGETPQDGQYYYDYTVTSATDLENLIVTVKVLEGGVTTYHRRTTEVTEFEADLTEMQADVTEIKSKTDYLPADTSTKLTTIGSQVTTVQNTLENATTGLAPIKTAINTVDTVVNAIKTKTDHLPADTSGELDNIDSAIANAQTATTDAEDNITALLGNATYGLNALKSLLDAIDTSTELSARFEEIKGDGWTSETMVQLDALLDAIKAKTDYLPSNTAQELTNIDTEIAATRERTDNLPDDPASQTEVETAIAITETNIRGDEVSNGVHGTIKTVYDRVTAHDETIQAAITTHETNVLAGIETQGIDLKTFISTHDIGVNTKLDTIQAATDNLTDNPADQASIEAAIAAAEENIRGGVQTLQTIYSKLGTHDSNMENTIEVLETALRGTNNKDLSVLSSQLTLHDNSIHSGITDITTAISTTESNIRGGDQSLETIKTSLDAAREDLTFVKNIEGGRWKIKSNQMIFYAADNETEVARFNLYDSGGSETSTNVYDRQRVTP